MTDIKKLRALLAEARKKMRPERISDDDFYNLKNRIDAALAEPVVKELDVVELEDAALDAEDGRRRAEVSLAEALSSARSWEVHTHAANLCAERAEKERDEARAEVAYWKGEFSRLHEEHLPVAFAGAYQRGAEAMREAAAACVGSDTALLQTYRSVLEGRIRDLPIPEDK